MNDLAYSNAFILYNSFSLRLTTLFTQKIKPKNNTKEQLSEMDDEYHSKFRTPETKTNIQKND